VVPNRLRAAATTADMGFQFANVRSQAGMFAVFTNSPLDRARIVDAALRVAAAT